MAWFQPVVSAQKQQQPDLCITGQCSPGQWTKCHGLWLGGALPSFVGTRSYQYFELQVRLDDSVPTRVAIVPLQVRFVQVSVSLGTRRTWKYGCCCALEDVKHPLASEKFDAFPAAWGSGRRVAFIDLRPIEWSTLT